MCGRKRRPAVSQSKQPVECRRPGRHACPVLRSFAHTHPPGARPHAPAAADVDCLDGGGRAGVCAGRHGLGGGGARGPPEAQGEADKKQRREELAAQWGPCRRLLQPPVARQVCMCRLRAPPACTPLRSARLWCPHPCPAPPRASASSTTRPRRRWAWRARAARCCGSGTRARARTASCHPSSSPSSLRWSRTRRWRLCGTTMGPTAAARPRAPSRTPDGSARAYEGAHTARRAGAAAFPAQHLSGASLPGRAAGPCSVLVCGRLRAGSARPCAHVLVHRCFVAFRLHVLWFFLCSSTMGSIRLSSYASISHQFCIQPILSPCGYTAVFNDSFEM